jgi:hypothetical protein
MNRADLILRANNVGVDPANYPNDSKLEQRVIYEEKNSATEAGALAVGTITGTNVFANGETITIGGRVYTFKTALTEAKAVQTLTGTDVFSNGETIGIGGVTYRMVTALSSPAVANEVLIGASLAASLDNLKQAINQGDSAYPTAASNEGSGTNWSTGTLRHPSVVATTNTNTTQVVQSVTPGTDGNSIGVSESAANASWGAANLAGGVNPVWGEILVSGVLATDLDYLKDAINATSVVGTPGTHYSSNTTAHDEVTATTNTNTTQVVEARSYDSGENIATTETAANASWGAAALASGSPKVVAASASANQAVSGGAKV